VHIHDLTTAEQAALARIHSTENLASLEEVRVAYLGKKGQISQYLQSLGTLPAEERKNFGAAVNAVKDKITTALDTRKEKLEEVALTVALAQEVVDITLPVRSQAIGYVHPVSRVVQECVAILGAMGFEVKDGPEIEDDFHNFTALNVPQDHPARQMQDTFYLNANDAQGKPLLLRTHTSSVQVRAITAQKPPFKFIAPGRVYRSDYDVTHTPMFHQIEGVYIDKAIHMGHLKGCLNEFLRRFFELDTVPLRFRPSFFPFTEPSAEVDIGCVRSKERIVIGGGSDWLEILGCGMVHPHVLKNIGVDPEEYQGFAFGIGIERLAMLKYGAPDLRAFFDSDVRWLSHYGFTLSMIGAGK
jgi:phenylalanyl-tRNA synthetase alpha chain